MNLPRLWGKKKTLAGAGAAVLFLFWRGIYEKNGRSLRTQQNLIGKYRSKLWRNESVKTKC